MQAEWRELPSPFRVLAVESSCDETAVAVVEDGERVLANVVASQAELHAQYGGVFPEVASRQHIKAIYPVMEEALRQAHLTLDEVDLLAVTRGPGLPGSLSVGVNFTKGLALGSGLPLVGVHHLEGHVYAAFLRLPDAPGGGAPHFPAVVLVVSGGHTELLLMRGHLTYERLGGTRDDAAREAFDKVARLLGLGYPGGPAIQQAAAEGDPNAFPFTRPWLKGTWAFSFSGLKTAVLREVRALEARGEPLPVADLAASFQATVVDVLVGKTLAAARAFQARSIVVAGGVSANRLLRARLLAEAEVPVHIPPLRLCTDNAAMIAGAATWRYRAGQSDDLGFDILPTWSLDELPPPPPQAPSG